MTQAADDLPVRAHVYVHGHVQGVGFRAFAARAATELDLVGGVRNLEDGRVEVDVEGRKSVLDAFIEKLKIGPPAGRVTQLDIQWGSANGQYSTLSIWR
ncbi:MAG: acylphosphatase [Nitrospira sp. WS238]|nr:acylphosphatase [Nitrospira sp. WS238]